VSATVVAFQGELGAYSHEALEARYGEAATPLPCRTFQEVADRMISGEAALGLLPVENTLAGAVIGSYDVLAHGAVRIVDEVILPIRHCLLAPTGATLEGLRQVLSHPVALAQCGLFLKDHPDLEPVAFYDTAGAAREVATRADPATPAIASWLAARRYGLQVLAEGIEDRDDNQTRFFALVPKGGADPDAPSRTEGADARKAAVVAEIRNEPGSLVRLLTAFAERGLDLTSIHGRPTGDPWQYRFILEMTVPRPGRDLENALGRAGDAAIRLDVLGVFPPAETTSTVRRGPAVEQSK
jgi:prephenate dehydratase